MRAIFRVWMMGLVVFAGGLSAMAQTTNDGCCVFAVGAYGGSSSSGEAGGYFTMYSTGSVRKAPPGGIKLELGFTRPGSQLPMDGLFSIDYIVTYDTAKYPNGAGKKPIFFFVNGGYSCFFISGSALNYGGGVLWRYGGHADDFRALRLEYRQAYLPGRANVGSFRLSHEWGGVLDQ